VICSRSYFRSTALPEDSMKYRKRRTALARLMIASIVILFAFPAASSARNEGAVVLQEDLRNYRFKAFTSPKKLTLQATEQLGTTVKVQIKYIQLYDPESGSMISALNNVVEALDAAVRARLIEDLHADDARIQHEKIQYKGEPAAEYRARQKDARESLESKGFVKSSKTLTVGDTEWEAWYRKVGVENADLGEIRGTVVLKLAPKFDTQNFVFLEDGFGIEDSPKYNTRNLTKDKTKLPQLKAQFLDFKARFTDAYKGVLVQLNKTGGRLFKSDAALKKFKNSSVGTVISKEKGVSIPFMGKRFKWRIKLKVTAGEFIFPEDGRLPDSSRPDQPTLESDKDW